MFARWRNLAAAAGALCFPFSLAQAFTQTDFSHSRPAPCIRFQESNDESIWFRTERNSWYQQYYGNTLDDASITDEPLVTPRNHTAPATKPSVIISDIESINDVNDNLLSNDYSNECDYFHCPCHDILNSEDNDADEDDSLETTTPIIVDLESQFFDVYAPYAYPDLNNEGSSKSEPAADLTGSIEPISDDSEAVFFDQELRGDEATPQPAVILNGINPISSFDDCDSGDDDEIDGDTDFNDSNNGGPKYHMFYPGCDWSPYYPASKSIKSSSPQLPEDVRSA